MFRLLEGDGNLEKIFNQFACSKIILPEHWQGLQDLQRESELKYRVMPEYEKQELENWEILIKKSIQNGSTLNIQIKENKVCSGIVTKLFYIRKIIFVDSANGIKQICCQAISFLKKIYLLNFTVFSTDNLNLIFTAVCFLSIIHTI